jgi:hypothetical protein
VKAFLIAQHLPLGLLTMVVFGFLVPEPGIAVGKTPINTISICGIFLIRWVAGGATHAPRSSLCAPRA